MVCMFIPAVSGVLPANMTAAITAWGGTAEGETHTVRTYTATHKLYSITVKYR